MDGRLSGLVVHIGGVVAPCRDMSPGVFTTTIKMAGARTLNLKYEVILRYICAATFVFVCVFARGRSQREAGLGLVRVSVEIDCLLFSLWIYCIRYGYLF